MFKWLTGNREPIDKIIRGIKDRQYRISISDGRCDRYNLIVTQDIELYRNVRDRGEVAIQITEKDHLASRPHIVRYSSATDGWMTEREIELIYKTAKKIHKEDKDARDRNKQNIAQAHQKRIDDARHTELITLLGEMDRAEE